MTDQEKRRLIDIFANKIYNAVMDFYESSDAAYEEFEGLGPEVATKLSKNAKIEMATQLGISYTVLCGTK